MRLVWIAAAAWLALVPWARADGSLAVTRAVMPVSIVGYSRSVMTATISSEVAGKIMQVAYDVSDRIGKSSAVTIDATFVRLELAQMDETIRKVGLALERAQSGFRFREREFQRISQLFQSGTASENELDRVSESRDQARLDADALAAELALAKVQQRILRERLRRHHITAPAGWRVVTRHVEPGEFVTVGMPVITVADFSRLVVPLAVSADQRDALERLGSSIAGTLDGLPAEAEIRWINPKFDPDTRKIALELTLTRFSGPARGGRRFEVALMLPAAGLMVPKAAVDGRFDNPRVTLQATGIPVPVQVLGETETHYRIADTDRLPVGTVLKSVSLGRATTRESQ